METKEVKTARAELVKSLDQLQEPHDLARVQTLVNGIISQRSVMAAFSASVQATAETERKAREVEQARQVQARRERAAKRARAAARETAAKPSPWLAITEMVKSKSR